MALPATQQAFKISASIISGPHKGINLEFKKDSIFVGRSLENDIVLPKDPKVSRRHLELRWQNGNLYAINLSQKNFFLIDGNEGENVRIGNDVILSVGESEIRIITQSSIPQQQSQTPTPRPVNNNIQPQFTGGYSPAPAQKMSQTPSVPNYNNPAVNKQAAAATPFANPSTNYNFTPPQSNNSRLRFYGIIAAIALVGYFLFSGPALQKKTDPNQIRTFSQIENEIKLSNEEKNKIKENLDKIENSSRSTLIKKAEENFIRGFREYSAGNYNRAIEAFQAVLNLDPEHVLAKRYLNLAKLKLDEQVKQIMLIANGYRQTKNWHKCKSSYQNVMTLLISKQNDSAFKEAKELYEECSLSLRSSK